MAVEYTVNAELERIKERAQERINLAKELKIKDRGVLITDIFGESLAEFHFGRGYSEEIGDVYLIDETGTHTYRRKLLIANLSGSCLSISLVDKKKGFMKRKIQKKEVYKQSFGDPEIFRDEKNWLSHFERIYEKAAEIDKEKKEKEIRGLKDRFGLED